MKKDVLVGIIVNALFFVLISIANYFYNIPLDVSEYVTKSAASMLFVLCGVFNLVYMLVLKKNEYLKFAVIMVIGLIFACAGDILLIDHFVIGAASFAVGHVFYFVAFCVLAKLHWRDFAIGGGIFLFALMLIIFYPFDFEGMTALIVVYALIISMMLGKAISNVFTKNLSKSELILSIVIAIGAFLFFFSDVMLVFRWFGGGAKIFSYLCIGTYYPANLILAASIFLRAFMVAKND